MSILRLLSLFLVLFGRVEIRGRWTCSRAVHSFPSTGVLAGGAVAALRAARLGKRFLPAVNDRDSSLERVEEGLNLGEVRYLEGKCTGTAVPVADNGKTLTVETDFPDDKSECDVGALHLTPRKDGEADIVYYAANGEKAATGILRRR